MKLHFVSRLLLPSLVCLTLSGMLPASATPAIETGFSPEGSALQLVLKVVNTAQQNIRLMGYSFTSPAVVRSLISAKRRGIDVQVVLDEKANVGKANMAAMDLLVNPGIPVRTVSSFKALHDKVIIVDGKNTQVGSFNFSLAADKLNSENVLVVWGDFTVAQTYLQHWQSRWNKGTDWRSSY
ncbi:MULTISPECIES: phospholipase D family nuclease [Yersinia]|uniref:phospholipase D family nuclease n=1 Tax=Yersinia TaxID=629 RepID=UPI00119E2DD2|nr:MULTISPECIES: phospholipase D family protein [Yersinia]HDL7680691.1 phospholipase D family protein [Yersinia enterocolitica]MCB5314373.1 phospholipase D family protein [Yersinia intermedia]MCB5324788.1 phospholipase D family protein [Yersinia intermedia]MCB5328336.1 phospholipase D family protein [Yersinia intermedia]MDN0096050.1 phospholipase D family protein [Yersinia rohdei]